VEIALIIVKFIDIVTCRPIARERLGKHIPAATNTQATSIAIQRCCKYNNRGGGVFYIVLIYPLLDNRCVFFGPTLRLYK
jgi:hypothetical protein